MKPQPGANHKPEQMATEIQRAVQQVIAKGLQDPRVSGLITVTSVRVTEDLVEAFINISIYPEEREKLTLHGLESAKSFIRREAGALIRSRFLPAFVFKLDRSLKIQAGIFHDINRAMDETRAREAAAAAAAAAAAKLSKPDSTTDVPPKAQEDAQR